VTSVQCGPDVNVLITSNADRKVVLFDYVDDANGIGCIGNRVRDALRRVNLPIPIQAFDFLTIALSVTAADEFVSRSDGAYGFTREISLSVSLANPVTWEQERNSLEAILRFLTGDDWRLSFTGNGLPPPLQSEKNRLRNLFDISGIEQVCLFSGGLDSLIGAMGALESKPHETLLVSRASTGDQMFQKYLLGRLGSPKQLGVNDRPSKPSTVAWEKEDSTRSRSILFLALAACCAAAIFKRNPAQRVPLLIPENGFIALNPPMTHRRRGPLSTRTAHPYYLSSLQKLFDNVGMGIDIRNPFEFMTKGEMIKGCNDQNLIKSLAPKTISCGKWKRRNQQCGKCVPCLIRRSSNFAASVTEPDNLYEFSDLKDLGFGKKKGADLAAVLMALKNVSLDSLPRWVSASGPLPTDTKVRKMYYEVAWRGLKELESFLIAQGFKT